MPCPTAQLSPGTRLCCVPTSCCLEVLPELPRPIAAFHHIGVFFLLHRERKVKEINPNCTSPVESTCKKKPPPKPRASVKALPGGCYKPTEARDQELRAASLGPAPLPPLFWSEFLAFVDSSQNLYFHGANFSTTQKKKTPNPKAERQSNLCSCPPLPQALPAGRPRVLRLGLFSEDILL